MHSGGVKVAITGDASSRVHAADDEGSAIVTLAIAEGNPGAFEVVLTRK